jgi:hypothetical protein
MVILLVAILLLAMMPALAMAQGRANPERTFRFVMNAANPRPAQLAAKPGAPLRAGVPARVTIQPNAIYGLLNEGFENPWPTNAWGVNEYSGFHDICWGADDHMPYKGQMSAWVAAGCVDGYDPDGWPYYENDMETEMLYPMDLSAATRGAVRFVFRNDSEVWFDYFYWCATPDYGSNWYCDYHTGSTGGRWRTVNVNLANVPGYGNMLGEPGFGFLWGFYSDFSITLEGPYVDAIRIKAVGP